jgi:ABC-type transport system substrate-binding protein
MTKRKQAMAEMQRIVSEDLPCIFLWHHWKVLAWKAEFENVLESFRPVGWYSPTHIAGIWWTKGTLPTTGTTTVVSTTVRTTTAPPPPPAGPDTTTIVMAVVVIGVLLAGGYAWMKRQKPQKPQK